MLNCYNLGDGVLPERVLNNYTFEPLEVVTCRFPISLCLVEHILAIPSANH